MISNTPFDSAAFNNFFTSAGSDITALGAPFDNLPTLAIAGQPTWDAPTFSVQPSTTAQPSYEWLELPAGSTDWEGSASRTTNAGAAAESLTKPLDSSKQYRCIAYLSSAEVPPVYSNIIRAAAPAPSPSKSTPVFSGTNTLSGHAGSFSAQQVTATMSAAAFGTPPDPLGVTATLSGACLSAPIPIRLDTSVNGPIVFTFPANVLNALEPCDYIISVQSDGNANNYATAPTEIGKLTVTASLPTTWIIPESLRVTRGKSYPFVTTMPEGRDMPKLSAVASANNRVSLDDKGNLTVAKNAKYGKITVTLTDEANNALSCEINIVTNQFTRSKPLALRNPETMVGEKGIFTSTHKLYYKKDNKGKTRLYIEVFLLNRTGKQLSKGRNMLLEIKDGEEILFSKSIKNWNRARKLNHKQYTRLKLSLTSADMLNLDLGHGEIQAIITGNSTSGIQFTPLTNATQNAITQKGAQMVPMAEDVELIAE